MKKIVRLTESDLTRLVRRIINEQPEEEPEYMEILRNEGNLNDQNLWNFMQNIEAIGDNEAWGGLPFNERYETIIGTFSGGDKRVAQALEEYIRDESKKGKSYKEWPWQYGDEDFFGDF